ncbi:hypothetical protein DFP72DRAFT_935962, partial [Ephemerocybe angulata]
MRGSFLCCRFSDSWVLGFPSWIGFAFLVLLGRAGVLSRVVFDAERVHVVGSARARRFSLFLRTLLPFPSFCSTLGLSTPVCGSFVHLFVSGFGGAALGDGAAFFALLRLPPSFRVML